MAAAGKLDFELVTPYRQVFRLPVDEVVCPGLEGEFGVLPGHAPLLAVLKIGVLGYRVGHDWRYAAIEWGYCEVANDRVAVMAEAAAPAEEIDAAAAIRARDEAEARIRALQPGSEEQALAMTDLEKALSLLQTVRWKE